MFSGKNPNYMKLRTNLRLCINRLKLLEKKKTELALKARRDIADYIANGKDDRARIRVEHIVREDYMVEAMEIVEMFCDLLLARFGLIEKMKEMDPGLEEAIATVIWVTPRLLADVQELKEVSHQLTLKYGKEWAEQCKRNGFENVNEKVLHKLSVAAPSRLLVENYMVEIAKTYKVAFEPDVGIMAGDNIPEAADLINLSGVTNTAAGGIGFEGMHAGAAGQGLAPMAYPPPAGMMPPFQPGVDTVAPTAPHPAGSYPGAPPPGSYSEKPGLPPGDVSHGGGAVNGSAPAGYAGPPPPQGYNPTLPSYNSVVNQPGSYPVAGQPNPGAASGGGGAPAGLPNLPDIPGLPSVPNSTVGAQSAGGDDVDFDDLTKRFEELKKKK